MPKLEAPKCMVCGDYLSWHPDTASSRSCGRPECMAKLGALCRAIWEGHLLRNNVDVTKDRP